MEEKNKSPPPKGQKVVFSNGPDDLVKEGFRYNIPSPVRQIGKTCWYATAFNMLNYYGLHENFADFQKRPPNGVTQEEWAWLKELSGNKSIDREGMLMNMLMANRHPNFTLRSLDVANLTQEVTRDKIIELLKIGPVYISMNEHPSASTANMWNSEGNGHLVPGDHDVVYRTTKDIGGTPHAMLLVGYMRRDYDKLVLEKALSNANGYNPFKIFEGTVGYDHKTMELILLDPNWPSGSDNKNNVILVDWYDISEPQNIRKIMYITENDKRSSTENSRAATPQRSTKENSRAATPQRSTKENSRAATPQRSTKENSRAATPQRSTKENSRAATPQRSTKENSRKAPTQRSSDSNIRNRGSSTNTKNKNEKKGGCILM